MPPVRPERVDIEKLCATQGAAATFHAVEVYRTALAVEARATASMLAALPPGARLDGLEWRRKELDSLARKVRSKAELRHLSPAESAAGVTDAVRYTVVSPSSGELAAHARAHLEGLRRDGVELVEAEHSFVEGNTYKGLHVLARDPQTGMCWEVQFHSERSLEIKMQELVPLYHVARDIDRPMDERLKAKQRMVELAQEIDPPPHLDDLVGPGGPLAEVGLVVKRNG